MPTALELREGVASLALLAIRDLSGVWAAVSTPEQARAALLEAIPALVDRYGSAAAAVAADWYDDMRDAAGVGGRFFAIPAEVGDVGADALARWGIGPLFADEPDWLLARSLIAGGLQRRIVNLARDTVMGSSIADKRAIGWSRAGAGGCEFCAMLIGRGAVYTEATASFESHDRCHCVAVPEFAT